MLRRPTGSRPAPPAGGALARTSPVSARYLGAAAPAERPCSRSPSGSSACPSSPPPALCARGRAAPQPSLRLSDSGNGPAARGRGSGRAAPVTGNASARAGPPPSRGAACLSLRAPGCPSAAFRRSALELEQFCQLPPHPLLGRSGRPELCGYPARGGGRSGPGSFVRTRGASAETGQRWPDEGSADSLV